MLTLVLALAVLGVMLLRLAGYLGGVPGEASATATVMPSPAATRIQQQVLPTEPLQTPQPAQTLTAQANASTPAADWSNRLLDQSLEVIQNPPPIGPGIVWWRSSDFTGQLSRGGEDVLLGGDVLNLDSITSLLILTPDPSNPDQLVEQGGINWEGDALLLSTAASANNTSADWLLSRGTAAQALAALVEQAEVREMVLNAAYTGSTGGEARLVLISASELGGATPTPAPTNPGYTPTPARTPTPLPTATPTRVPEAYMGQVVAGLFQPVITSADDFPPDVVQDYLDAHPWTGTLTWTETGPQIGGLPVAVDDATELNFYAFQTEGEDAGATERFFHVTYNGSVTRFPEQQLIFQEQRMDEVLYWVVRAAAQQGGQLTVAFDDFGARQAITVLGFRPYDN